MRELAERSWFFLCLVSGRLLRAGTYSRVVIGGAYRAGDVRKQRRFYAPLLIVLGNVLMRMLNTGVRVLRQEEWETHERQMYGSLYRMSVHIERSVLELPCLPGETLATLLDDPAREVSIRGHAITLAATALAELHERGFTHGDAMAENVMIDLDAGVARWFDFETSHDADRSMTWRRADDVRALLSTCVLRTGPEAVPVIAGAYGVGIMRVVATYFTSPYRRPLPFHLGQAALSYGQFRTIDHALSAIGAGNTHGPAANGAETGLTGYS